MEEGVSNLCLIVNTIDSKYSKYIPCHNYLTLPNSGVMMGFILAL